ncbi:kinase-like protein [Rozella allomycis CSF55]|uniref:non-specific serine/threonine protein kinase n=1 Tax=Rozella allomycis (strain CSF55) TaxID=988480 RepID=A0A4V1J080_ROZAC|nr:kinase-like protein [Rozella allomycis CSF55]
MKFTFLPFWLFVTFVGCDLPQKIKLDAQKDFIFVTSLDGDLMALSIANGDLKWKTNILTPTVNQDTKLINQEYYIDPSGYGHLYSLDADKRLIKWQNSIPELVAQSPVQISKDLIVGHKTGSIYSLDSRNGNIDILLHNELEVDSTSCDLKSENSIIIGRNDRLAWSVSIAAPISNAFYMLKGYDAVPVSIHSSKTSKILYKHLSGITLILPMSNKENKLLGHVSSDLVVYRKKNELLEHFKGDKKVEKWDQQLIVSDRSHLKIPWLYLALFFMASYGSHGTVVFKGYFDGREVAVKRMLLDFIDSGGQEVALLKETDEHPNVVRYFCKEECDQFLYIALELCSASLQDLFEKQEELASLLKLVDKNQIVVDVLNGVSHLHKMNIVHRDLKPANILINSKGRCLITDFGLSKKLKMGQSSFMPTFYAGTIGWRAPEILLVVNSSSNSSSETFRAKYLSRMTKSVDLFSLGCMIHYVLTDGKHPFGDGHEREANIISSKISLDENLSPLAANLISKLIRNIPSQRISAEEALLHPYFWNANKCLNFIQEVSDFTDKLDKGDHRLHSLEKRNLHVYEKEWTRKLDRIFLLDIFQFRNYDQKSLKDLLRRHHYHEIDPQVQKIIGSLPNGYWTYFSSRFPNLLLQVYEYIIAMNLHLENPFHQFFIN